MNKIKKFKEELENYEKKYALLIKECIQEEINKINPEIESSPDSCVKCYTMFLPFLLIKIDVFS